MAIHVTIGLFKNQFAAELSDGRCIERPDFRALALALVHAGVRADNVQFGWKAGQRMLTAGQQVALHAEMRRLENEYRVLSSAA